MPSRRIPRVALAVLLALTGVIGSLTTVTITAEPAAAAPIVADFDFLNRINAERSARGLSRLQMSSKLAGYAHNWSQQMRSQGRLSHRPNLAAMAEDVTGTYNWTAVAENVGYGGDVAGLHAAFKGSPDHWANIIDPRWNYAGIGTVYGSDGKLWTTHNFLASTKALPTATGPTSSGTPFADVPAGAYYAGAVAWAARNNVTTGCAPSRFCPNEPTTRAQMVTLLWRHLGSPKAPRPAPFVDVPRGSYFAPAVDWAYAAGVTTGCSANRFCPHERALRAQMVTFLYRAKGSPTASTSNKFRDVPSNAYFARAVTWANRQGITTGCVPDRFCPNEVATRAHGITFIHRYAGRPRT